MFVWFSVLTFFLLLISRIKINISLFLFWRPYPLGTAYIKTKRLYDSCSINIAISATTDRCIKTELHAAYYGCFSVVIISVSGTVCVKDHIVCSRLHADAWNCSAVWLETQLRWHRPDVAWWLYHSQVCYFTLTVIRRWAYLVALWSTWQGSHASWRVT